MPLITSKITIFLPFKSDVKEGDDYRPITKKLENGGQIVIWPFEYLSERPRNINIGSIVQDDRKLRIDITLPFESDEIKLPNDDQQRLFFTAANEYLNNFLLHCKTKGKQYWWVPLSLIPPSPARFAYHVQWVDHNSRILGEYGGTIGSGIVLGIGINKEIWDETSAGIINDVSPSIVDFHFEEARSALFAKNVHIMIINTAIAFEIFTSQFCTELAAKLGMESDATYLSYLNDNNYGFVRKYFKHILPYLQPKDISHNLDKYNLIDYLFRTRNSIVHNGKSRYKDDTGTVHNVYYKEAHSFFFNAADVMNWLRSIDPDIADLLKWFKDTR